MPCQSFRRIGDRPRSVAMVVCGGSQVKWTKRVLIVSGRDVAESTETMFAFCAPARAMAHPRDDGAEGDQRSCSPGRIDQAGHQPRLSAQFRHASAGGRPRRPHDPDAAGTRAPGDNDDLHARRGAGCPGRVAGAKPNGCAVKGYRWRQTLAIFFRASTCSHVACRRASAPYPFASARPCAAAGPVIPCFLLSMVYGDFRCHGGAVSGGVRGGHYSTPLITMTYVRSGSENNAPTRTKRTRSGKPTQRRGNVGGPGTVRGIPLAPGPGCRHISCPPPSARSLPADRAVAPVSPRRAGLAP